MQNRVSKILGSSATGLPWLGTFHSICAKLLRKHAPAVNLNSNFTIIDTDDQIRLIKNICKAENIDVKQISPRYILAIIDRWKNKGYYPNEVRINNKDIYEKTILPIYKIYQQKLTELNSCDFGDLILHVVKILEKNSDIKKIYSKNFKYILVDEYQDTNICQYKWLNLLSKKYNNICVVGDDDQSIYSWRGAEVGNILRFGKDYKHAKIIKLEKNYRSTKNILDASNFLISKNKKRMGKNLWTDAEQGEKIEIINPDNSEEEAIEVSNRIECLSRNGTNLSNVAILLRASFQTRFFEERFIKIGLPYKIIGGTKFYERLEIRDALAYLRLLVSDYDDLAFERIINVPKRGLGDQSMQKIEILARDKKMPLLTASKLIIEEGVLSSKANNNLSNFIKLLELWRQKYKSISASEMAEVVLEESGYTDYWKNEKSVEAEGRLENLKELINAISDFDDLKGFLEHIQLVMDNNYNNNKDSVNLLTLHAAKGLEFKYVFLPGWEEEIFPNRRSLEEKFTEGLEEERRLAYVGITRAKKQVWILHANNRVIHGQWFYSMPSRFIRELPDKNIKSNMGLHDTNSNHMKEQFIDSQIESDEFKSISLINKIEKGTKVFHQKFGYGVVQDIEEDNAEVKFDKTNIKKVKKNYLFKEK